MRDAVSGEEIAEVEPKTQLSVMRVTILEAFDVASGSRFVKIVFKLRHSILDCCKTVGRCDLSCGPHCKEATRRYDERQQCGGFQQAFDHEAPLKDQSPVRQIVVHPERLLHCELS